MYALFKNKGYASNKSNLLATLTQLKNNLLDRVKVNEDGKSDYKKYEIKRVGRLLEGEAYYHEVDQYYKCVGFEVEVEYQFDFQDKPSTDVGFYSVWVGKSHDCAPIEFDEGDNFGKGWHFANGLGDKLEVLKDLASVEEVQAVIKANKLF